MNSVRWRLRCTSLGEKKPEFWLDKRARDFSKKIKNHAHSMALFTTYYNFVRVHKTLRVTPAMAACVSDRLWEVSDIVALLEATEARPCNRGSYNEETA
jgi:hypothetical protein